MKITSTHEAVLKEIKSRENHINQLVGLIREHTYQIEELQNLIDGNQAILDQLQGFPLTKD